MQPVSNDKEMIDQQNDWDDICALILKYKQSSIDTWCHKHNGDHEVLKSAIQKVRRLFHAINRLSHAGYHLPGSFWFWVVVTAPILEQMKVSLRWMHIDLFLQVNPQETRVYEHVTDSKCVPCGNEECQPHVVKVSSQYIRGLVVDDFDVVVSLTHTSLALNRCTLSAPSRLILYSQWLG